MIRHSVTTFKSGGGSNQGDDASRRKSTTRSSSSTTSLHNTPHSYTANHVNTTSSTTAWPPPQHTSTTASVVPPSNPVDLSYSSIPYQHSRSIPGPDFSNTIHNNIWNAEDDLEDKYSVYSSITIESKASSNSKPASAPPPVEEKTPSSVTLPDWANERLPRYYKKIYNNSLAGVPSDLQTFFVGNGKTISFKFRQQMITIPTSEHDAIVIQGLKAHPSLIFYPNFNGKAVFWHKDAPLPAGVYLPNTSTSTPQPSRNTPVQDSLQMNAIQNYASSLLAGNEVILPTATTAAVDTSNSLSTLTTSTINRSKDSAQRSGSSISSNGAKAHDANMQMLFKLYNHAKLTIISNISATSSSSLSMQMLLSTSSPTTSSSSNPGIRSLTNTNTRGRRSVIFTYEDMTTSSSSSSVGISHISSARFEVLRGILQHCHVTGQKQEVRILVSPSFYHQQQEFYKSIAFAAAAHHVTIRVFPLLLTWQHMNIRTLWQLLRFAHEHSSNPNNNEESMFNIALQSLLQQYQRQNRTFTSEDLSYAHFLQDLQTQCESLELTSDLLYARFALLDEIVLESNSNLSMFKDGVAYTEHLSRESQDGNEALTLLVDLTDPMLRRDTVCILYSLILRQLTMLTTTTKVLLHNIDALLMFSLSSSSISKTGGFDVIQNELDDFTSEVTGKGSTAASEEMLSQINVLATNYPALQLIISCTNPALLPLYIWRTASLVLLYQHSLQRHAVRFVQETLQLSDAAIKMWTMPSNNEVVYVRIEDLKLWSALSLEEQQIMQVQEADGLFKLNIPQNAYIS